MCVSMFVLSRVWVFVVAIIIMCVASPAILFTTVVCSSFFLAECEIKTRLSASGTKTGEHDQRRRKYCGELHAHRSRSGGPYHLSPLHGKGEYRNGERAEDRLVHNWKVNTRLKKTSFSRAQNDHREE